MKKRFQSAQAENPAGAAAKSGALKKYIFSAPKIQREKPTEPHYMFCADAQTAVYAASEEEARLLAAEKLTKEFYGTGCLLGEAELAGCYELPVDWSYGYGEGRRSGATGKIGDLTGNNVIR